MKLWLQRGACALLALAAVSGLWFIWQHRDMPSFGAIQDDGIYMLSARAISQGDSYRLTHLPSQPLQTKYPPLLPAAVAAIWTLAPGFSHFN